MDNNYLQLTFISYLILIFSFGFTSFLNLGLVNGQEIPNLEGKIPAKATNLNMSYTKFLKYLDMKWVKQVDFYNNNRYVIIQASSPELDNLTKPVRVNLPIGDLQVIKKLKKYDINFDSHPMPRKNLFIIILSNLIVPIAFLGGLIFLYFNSNDFSSDTPSPMNVGKSPARFEKRSNTGVTFEDVAGVDEAKLEIEEIVSFLKETDKYTRVGARIPKGSLLVGPPGTGKTLLAKAIASEAEVPFFSAAGSEFVEMFIGIGASRIRDLFDKAYENTPCIIFIDEIDAVGRERGSGIGGGNDEREQTLNQLLTEMDGFVENKGIIILGATNRADILDAALLRPGRFDRRITIGLPNFKGRVDILKVHSKNKPLSQTISLEKLAMRTPGFSGAELANLLNEAAILCTRYKCSLITKKEVDEAIDRVIGGVIGTKLEDDKPKHLIAYHEMGHAIVASVLEEHEEVDKITITPRGRNKGLTWFRFNEDQILISRKQLIEKIIVILAGQLTEQIIFGTAELTNGAINDLRQATTIARQMVTEYGMSKLGPIAFNVLPDSPEIRNKIDKEVERILSGCEITARQIIRDNRVIIDFSVEYLLETETLNGKKLRNMIKLYSGIGEKTNLLKNPNY